MNIKITWSWLLEYLDTNAKPKDLQKYLSLCGPSVEKITEKKGDFVFDIEVTSNRVDSASVLGIAQEARAILPQFDKQAKLKLNPLDKYKFESIKEVEDPLHTLNATVSDDTLCPRFTAIVLSDVEVGQSPSFIKSRLSLCGINSLNNVVDISNYLMISLGQPAHVFDYDKIKNHTMKLRESNKGEKITTLDGKVFTLPGGDIVIEDGAGRLIDLCGIMGASNSAVSESTKNIILFAQTYNKARIRQTSMSLPLRTQAASYFEKGLDTERVEPTLVYGITLLKKYSSAKVSSTVVDLYPKPFKKKLITLPEDEIKRVVGINLESDKVQSILKRLGFEIETKNEEYRVSVPSYRDTDVEIVPDVIEEVARVYGYFNLPSTIQKSKQVSQPEEITKIFKIESATKLFLKHLGLVEAKNYSMISGDQIRKLDLKFTDHLRIINPISSEIEFMRTSLAPSLIKNIGDNLGKEGKLAFFELAKTYHKQKDALPDENRKLAIVVNTDFLDLKGILESLFDEFNIKNVVFNPIDKSPYLSKQIQAEIGKKGKLGFIGKLSDYYAAQFDIKEDIYIAELDLQSLTRLSQPLTQYKTPPQYAAVKLDLTFGLKRDELYRNVLSKIRGATRLLERVDLIDKFKNKITLRLYFASRTRNITEDEAKQELAKIKSEIKTNL